MEVVGDSITAIVAPRIHGVLDPRYHVEVTAEYGKRIDQMLPALASALRIRPNAVVENLGTNDALEGGRQHNWMSSWNQLIHMTRRTPCVVLTTIGISDDIVYGHKSIAADINSHITRLAAQDPRHYQVADWNGFLLRHAHSDLRRYLVPDLIHPTPAGSLEIANLDEKALARCAERNLISVP